MSRIPAKAAELRRSAATLHTDAKRIHEAPSSRLLLFYAVECEMKERYIVKHRGKLHGDTSSIESDPSGPFGSTGHDLAAACKALRAPAKLLPAPRLTVHGQPKPIEHAHQAWRYGITCSGSETVEHWLRSVACWLKDTR